MDRTLEFLRDNPALLVPLCICAVGAFVLSIIGTAMHRAGMSLRPIAFLAVFMGLIVLPQFAGHLAIATGRLSHVGLTWVPEADRPLPVPVVDAAALTIERATDAPRFAAPARLFGADIADATLHDARPLLGGALTGAEAAQLAFFPNLQTALVASFPDARAARAAWASALAQLGAAAPGEPDAPVTFRRAADLARVAVAGRALLLWSALDEAALDRRMRAGDALRFVTPEEAADLRTARDGRAPWRPGWRLLALFVLVNVAAASLWFFKGSAWAARVPPAAPRALSAPELLARLRAAAPPDAPWTLTQGETPDELEVSWRYADARWLDFAGAQAMTRVHRLVLRLDAESRAVRVSEYWTRFDASLGRPGVGVRWQRSGGILFFESRREAVLGLQLDGAGRPTGRTGYAYRFDLQELKAPFIAAATGAGWSWRPLVWDAPAWLRWATE